MSGCQSYCNFCGKNGDDVLCLVAGRNQVMICDECIELSRDIVGQERAKRNKGLPIDAALNERERAQ